MSRDPYPHQLDGMARLRHSLGTGHRRPMLCSPTGSGKTKLASMVVEGALSKGNRVTFVVPAVSLIDQTVQAFYAEGINNIGVIQADHVMTDWSKPVQVASVQTLQHRPKRPESSVVVIDEAHTLFDYHRKWMADPAWAKVPFIGLSATPWAKGLGQHFDDLIVVTTTAELIEKGFLSPFRVFAPSHPDLSKVRTVRGDYHEGELAEAMSPLIADVVQSWLERGENRPTLCFAVDRAHAKKLQAQFIASSVPAGYIDAYTPVDERAEIERQLNRGEIRVVCNVGCLTTGVDWDVRCIILARPTKSEMLFVQIIGRGIRTAPGKADCIILDHSDTHAQLGFVTEIHHDALDAGKRKKVGERKAPDRMPKECPQCHFLRPRHVLACPDCGFKPEVKSKIEHHDGHLKELGMAEATKFQVERAERQRWFSMLLHVARERDRQDGWAAHKFRERFKEWPNGLRKVTLEPDVAVLAFIKHTQIRWARTRAA